jgi:hypothetical protein
MTRIIGRKFLLLVLSEYIFAILVASPADAQQLAEQKNMLLISHNDLNGHGDGGDGMALQQWLDGRRILYISHLGLQTCLSIVDVSDPADPKMMNEIPSPGPGVTRCNSLGLSGNVLAVANQTLKDGQSPAGMWLLDVSDLGRIKNARGMQDLALSFFDTSGPNSPGVHGLWFVDGEFVHLTTGTRDSNPSNPLDNQFYVVVDVRDRVHPREVGRWWLAGTQKSDDCLPGCLPERHSIDDGYRVHNVEVYPDHSDRAYVGYIDGGQIILDISGLAEVRAARASSFSPKFISRLKFSPPFAGYTHTVHPLFSRGLATVIDETTKPLCADAPKLVWLDDIRAETNPVILATAPLPENVADLCKRGGKSGPHNLAPDFPSSTSAHLKNTFVGTFFNAGVRIYRLVDAPIPHAPPRIEEIAYFIPSAPPGNPSHTAQINHVIVDEKGLIYANDRITGGLYILQYTGTEPLD